MGAEEGEGEDFELEFGGEVEEWEREREGLLVSAAL